MATLKELTQRFREAGTSDETEVLTPEELKDPRTVQLSVLAKQNLAGTQDTQDTQEQQQGTSLPPTLKDAVSSKQPSPTIPYAAGIEPGTAAKITEGYKPAAPEPAGKPPAAPAEKAPSPSGIQKIVSDFQKQASSISGEARKELEGRISELGDLEKTYRQEAKEAKSDLEKRELAETMGHALAQFGAGLYGLKQGVDMSSGLKFNKTDWNKRYEAALDELKTNLADLREKRQEAQRGISERTREQLGEAQFETGLKAAEQGRRESEAAAAARAGAAQASVEQEKRLDRESKEKIATMNAISRQALANQKLSAEETAAANGALGSLAGAWAAVSEAEGGKEKQAAEKRALSLETDPRVTKYFSPQAIQQARKLAIGTPSNIWNLWSGEAGDPEAAQRALEAGRAAPGTSAAPAAPTGQAPAPGGTIKVKDATQGSPTFGQVKSVPNSAKVQQMIKEGRLQVVE